jgi:predicted Fe-Mo cluster-binding NifX family protein
MKICIPVTAPEGLAALLHSEFAAATHLLVVDPQSGEHHTYSSEEHDNPPDSDGQQAIAVDAVLCSDMPNKMVRAFSAQGIRVFTTLAETVAEALQALKAGEAAEQLAASGCCGGDREGEKGHGDCGKGAHQAEGQHECCAGRGGCSNTRG